MFQKTLPNDINDHNEKLENDDDDHDDDDYCENTMDIASPYSPGSNLIDMPQEQKQPAKPSGVIEDLFGESPDNNKALYTSSIFNRIVKKKTSGNLTAGMSYKFPTNFSLVHSVNFIPAALKSYGNDNFNLSNDSNIPAKDLVLTILYKVLI